jgi:hypothetical protein
MMHGSLEIKPSTATTKKPSNLPAYITLSIAFVAWIRSEITVNALDPSVTSGLTHLRKNTFGTTKALPISNIG